MTSIVKQSDQSPFDAIRHFDEHGNEFWSARELMPILGYSRWERVPDVIERAKLSCVNAGNLDVEHFSEGTRKTLGRPQQDFKLSRYACYLVAMNGDPRKPEIASAQTYFAVKAREAEVIIPAQNERIKELELRLKIAELEKATSDNQVYLQASSEFIVDTRGPAMLALIQGRPDAVVEKVEKVTETVICRDGRNVSFEGKSTAKLAREYGFKSGRQFEDWLAKQGQGHLVCQGFRAVQSPYVPTEDIDKIRRLWASRQGRQLMIGE
jgi:DNA-damage-inducible protein D